MNCCSMRAAACTWTTRFAHSARLSQQKFDARNVLVRLCSVVDVQSSSTGSIPFIASRCVSTSLGFYPNCLTFVQMWNGAMFVRATLTGLGLRLQLGHRVGGLCHNRSEERDLTVLHTNGHHELKVRFCHCQVVEEYQQLLRIRWWPATPIAPRSAFTFNVLRQWHYQNLQGNISAFDFYRSLEFLTDGTLSTTCKVSTV